MARALIHPKMLEKLADFYPAMCTIQSYDDENQNTHGQPQPVYANLAGHVDIPCRIAPSPREKSREVKREDMTYSVITHDISLAGDYPNVTSKMRAVVGGVSYDILYPQTDGQSHTTRLLVEVVT